MAQGAVAIMPLQNGVHVPELSAADIREIEEYEKIVSFRDRVLSGTHPTIQIATHHLATEKQKGSTAISDRAHVSAEQRKQHGPPTSTTLEGNASDLNRISNSGAAASEGHRIPTRYTKLETSSASLNTPRPDTNGALAKPPRSEINPILLEKSDDLIKAELQLQRQRLERALREQLDLQNVSRKALLQAAESLPNFDISKILAQALEKIPPLALEAEQSVGVASASDSFDENTFYSSQHDSPMPSSPSQTQKEPVTHSENVSSADKLVEAQQEEERVSDGDTFMTGAIIDNMPLSQTDSRQHQSPVGALETNLLRQIPILASAIQVDGAADDGGNREQVLASPRQDQSKESHNLDHTYTAEATKKLSLQEATHVRSHDLAPECPRPSRVSPLAVAREPPVVQEFTAHIPPPAQIAALRNEASGVSSTDHTPQARKGSEKKKDKKKKKRNGSNKETLDNLGSAPPVSIKTEPRSVSPYEVPPVPRPAKRQRQGGNVAAELNYDEPRYDAVEPDSSRYIDSRPHQLERYDRYPAPKPAATPIRRYTIDDKDERRLSEHYVRSQPAPREQDLQYAPVDFRPLRTASTALTERRSYEEPRYYSNAQVMPRASVRPDADRERSRSPIYNDRPTMPMGPPRQMMQRIIVDAYGREYIDPSAASSMRQPVAPRQNEPEMIYERTPYRSVSRRVPADVIEEDGVIYRRASPTIAQPRRIMSQPEYVQPDYRSYRHREYSVRPNDEDFIKIREVPEHLPVSQYEKLPREYIGRAPSVRPETVRYELPREYAPRLASVRPEPPPQDFATSVHPEVRREMVPPRLREYSVRPVEVAPRREYVMEGQGIRRYGSEIGQTAELAFIEQPRQREASILVYADDARREAREVYR